MSVAQQPEASGTDSASGLPFPRRLWAIAALILAIAITVLDTSLVNIALPLIARDLEIDPASAVWIVNAYQLTVTVAMLPLASLAEIIGYRRVQIFGLATFSLGSFVCAQADSLAVLLAARVLQGVGGAGIMSVNVALVRFIYPARLLGRGLGINALVVAVSASVGPTLAAGILHLGDWPWLFALNVPLGILSLLIGLRSMPEGPMSKHAFDTVSAALSVLTFGLLVVGIGQIGQGRYAWAAVGVAASGLFGRVLVRRQLRRSSPLLPVDLLRLPVFALSIGASLCAFLAQTLAFVALPFYFQGALGRTPVDTGLLMTPWPFMAALLTVLAARLIERVSADLVGSVGLLLLCTGLVLLAALPATAGDWQIAVYMGLCGGGLGLFHTPNNRTIMSSAPKHRSGGASGMLGTSRLLGQTLGAATTGITFHLFGGSATSTALLIAAGFAGLAALSGGLRLVKPKEGGH